MIVAIAGGSGLIGTALRAAYLADGARVLTIGRSASSDIQWDPAAGSLEASKLEGASVVINLAGEGVASGRWTAEKKRLIKQSRVDATRCIVQSINHLAKPPSVLVNASAIGIYGEGGDTVRDEVSAAGTDFLAETAIAWEGELKGLRSDVRCVVPRIGIVLSLRGGALQRMYLPFRLGLGGAVGSGKQFMSWITLSDTVRAIRFLAQRSEARGVYNLVAPGAVTNADFTRALGRALSMPAVMPLPGFLVRLIFGEMGEALLLRSVRAAPTKLLKERFTFSHADVSAGIVAALQDR